MLFFQVFQLGRERLLSRAWLIDPGVMHANVAATIKVGGDNEPWNGEFYVSFGGDCAWDDARAYGFISAGDGSWYSQTLKRLSPGDRVWVKIPGSGYVGVGGVSETVQSVNDFKVKRDGWEFPALEILSTADNLRKNAGDPDRAEYFVRIDWLDTLPKNEAVDEVGLFGNQNTVCQPTTPKWRHTIERLKSKFPKWDSLPD